GPRPQGLARTVRPTRPYPHGPILLLLVLVADFSDLYPAPEEPWRPGQRRPCGRDQRHCPAGAIHRTGVTLLSVLVEDTQTRLTGVKMQRQKIIIASVAVAVIAAVGGTTAALASGSSSSSAAPASSSAPASSGPANSASGAPASGAGTVRTAQATVNGKTETILVDAHGMPLYYYQPDTATQSAVTGQLAVAWPPLTSSAPTAAEVSGKITAVTNAHGSQVAYNGHLLYTFVTDSPDHVTGQGVQNFFVATPGLAQLAGTSAPAASTPATPASGGGYGY